MVTQTHVWEINHSWDASHIEEVGGRRKKINKQTKTIDDTDFCLHADVINHVLQLGRCGDYVLGCQSWAKVGHLFLVFNYNQSADIQTNMLQVTAVSVTPLVLVSISPAALQKHLGMCVSAVTQLFKGVIWNFSVFILVTKNYTSKYKPVLLKC